MSLAIPGSSGCFSFLQHALRPGAQRIKITNKVCDQLLDAICLAEDVSSVPTHIAKIVPAPPSYFGAMDASKSSMGGVWLPPGAPILLAITPYSSACLQNPCLWRTTFPQSIQEDFVSSGNPSGAVSNSDL